jgi:hypothetical protein
MSVSALRCQEEGNMGTMSPLPERKKLETADERRVAGSMGTRHLFLLLAFCVLGLTVRPAESVATEITVRVTEVKTEADCFGKVPKPPETILSARTFLALAATNGARAFGNCPAYIKFSGEITKESMRTLREVVTKLRAAGIKETLLWVTSEGGDLPAALSFGRFLREGEYHNLEVMVVTRCNSSCVFLLAGAFKRTPWTGKVGIHRPYLSPTTAREMGYKDLQRAYAGLLPQIKTFLKDANVKESLADDMWQIPSHQLKVLSDEELDAYGLSGNDAVLVEQENAKTRAECGNDAPSFEDDFWTTQMRCNEARGFTKEGGLDPECIALLEKHPFCPCFMKKYGDGNSTQLKCKRPLPPG